MKNNMFYLLMGSVILWESIGSGKLLCGVPQDKTQKLSQAKVNRVSLQK